MNIFIAVGYDANGQAVCGSDGSKIYRYKNYSTAEKKILDRKWSPKVLTIRSYQLDSQNVYDANLYKFINEYKVVTVQPNLHNIIYGA